MVPIPLNMENPSEAEPSKAKKRKIDVDENSVVKAENVEVFNSTRFKFLIRNEKTVYEALVMFEEYALRYPSAPNDVDIVSEFCELSDQGNEVLTLLKTPRIKSNVVVAIFNVLRCILVRVADDLVTYKKLAHNISQKLLTIYLEKICSTLSLYQKSKFSKSTLKLLTAIVVLGENPARNVLNKFNFGNTALIKALLERRNQLDEQDIRTCFLHFIMSFLMIGSDTIIHDLCKLGILPKIFAGLRVDNCPLVELVLPLILDKVVQNETITKSEKIKIFSNDVLSHLARVYNWLGPAKWKKAQQTVLEFEEIEESPDLESVRKLVHNLLLELCTSPKNGIIFFDKTFGASGRDQNRTIRLFLQDVHVMPFCEDSLLKDLILKIFHACPEQMQPFLFQVQNSITPRASEKWLKCMDFLEMILETQPEIPLPLKTSKKMPVENLLELVKGVVLPPQEILQPIIASTDSNKELSIRYRCLQYTLKLMKKLRSIFQFCQNGSFASESKVFSNADVERFNQMFKDQMTRVLPSLKSIFNNWEELNKNPNQEKKSESSKELSSEIDSVEHIIRLEQILCLYQTLWPEALSDFSALEEVFVQVQRICQNMQGQGQEQPTTDFNQQIRVRLYLLKLLAETDARKIPWNKTSEDGQGLLHFLFDTLITIRNDHQLLTFVKQLICQLLYHSGLFDGLEMELHVWMDWLIRCGHNEKSFVRNNDLLKFVATVFTHYICNPCPYIETVFVVTSEASLICTGMDDNDDIVSTSTIDDFIDRINELEDEELELNEDQMESNEENNRVKLPFSPLMVAAMKESSEKSEAQMEPLKNYLQCVLVDLFHSQANPIPLGIWVQREMKQKEQKHSWISKRISSYIKSWLPNKKILKKSPKVVDVESIKEEQHSPELLKAFYLNGKSLINDTDFVALLFKSVEQLNISESLRTAQQCLRYIQAQLENADQGLVMEDQNISVLQLHFKYLKKVVKHLFRKCQHQHKTESAILLSEDFQMLQIETLTNDRISAEILNFLSHQNAIQHWFLATEPGFIGESKSNVQVLRNLVTKELTNVFAEFPKSSGKGLFSFYCSKITAYLKEYLACLLKGPQADNLALVVLKQLNPYIDFGTIQESMELLLQLPAEKLLSEDQLSDSGQILTKLLSYLALNCPTFLLNTQSLDRVYLLLSHSKRVSKWLTICTTLFEAKPYFCLSCPAEVFGDLLNHASPETLNLASTLMTYNRELDQVFAQWVLDKDDLQENIENLLTICITWCKLQNTLPSGLNKKCLIKLSKDSRKYLCDWIHGNNTESKDYASNKLELLQHFGRLQARGFKHFASLDLFEGKLDSEMTMSREKLEVFLVLINWAESVKDTSVINTNCVRLDVCLKAFLRSVQARAGALEDRELESDLLNCLEKYLIVDLSLEHYDLLLSNWTSFIRSSLRNYYSDLRLLRILDHLIPKIYSDAKNSKTISPNLKDLHQMLIGHSDFLPLIMGSQSQISKELLVSILLTVVELEPECCAEGHLHILMGAYGASLSICDQKLLKMIYLYEKNGVDMVKLRPYLWGVKALEMYALSKEDTSLNKIPSTDRIFELIDSEKMAKSILHFPVKRKLLPSEVAPAEYWKSEESCYDPCFLLPVFSHLLAPFSKLRSLHFIMKNCLGYSLVALSSHDSEIRAAGYHILTRLEEQLGISNFHRKEQYLYLLRFLKNSINEENFKLPFVNAIYMMKISQILLNEGHLLYPAITAPLVNKPCQELNLIPEFFRLFSSSSPQHYHERMWMLYLLHDGLRESHDFHIYKKYYIFKILMSFANSVLCNHTNQVQILRILKRACDQKKGAFGLTRHSGIVSWFNHFISQINPHSETIVHLTEILHSLWFSLIQKNATDSENHLSSNHSDLPLPFIQEMQVVLLNLLQAYRDGTSYAAMKYFLPCFASVLLFKKKVAAQKIKDKRVDQNVKEEKEFPIQVKEEDENAIQEPKYSATSYISLELTPRDVLLVLYQSRCHASNEETGKRCLDLLKRWGYACHHLTEDSYSLQKQSTEKTTTTDDVNIENDLSDNCQDEDSTTCSKTELKKLRKSLIDICLSWIPSNVYKDPISKSPCFEETLELVMTCLCEEAISSQTPLSSVSDILLWVEAQFVKWDSAIEAIMRNTCQGKQQPVLLVSLLSLYVKLAGTSFTEESNPKLETATPGLPSEPQVQNLLCTLGNICRILCDKYQSFKDSDSLETNPLVSFLGKIAKEFRT